MSGGQPLVVADRPTPGSPRRYVFPGFNRHRLANGMTVLSVPLPGRPLVSAALVVAQGAGDEPAAHAGSTVLMARALSEGTDRFDAVALVEAGERLGASLHAEAGWDAASAGLDVPAERLGPALDLLAEMVGHPTFPASEVERLRDERLNDLLHAQSDPRRRADDGFAAAVYAPESPYGRPAAGSRETVERLDRVVLERIHRSLFDPARMTLVIGGDLAGIDVVGMAERCFGDWQAAREAVAPGPIAAPAAASHRRVRVLHRPGSVQTEIRVGHPGASRAVPDYHAIAVMSAILGGLFNSRLNRKLREEKGYTYGAGAGFDLRRGAGPFSARAAVNTDATVPALVDTLAELAAIREAAVTDDELRAGRDYLAGVFPLRFETPGAVVGALSGLAIHGLPDDELATYRARIEAVSAGDVLAAARAHVRPAEAAIVLVGDADAFLADLEAAEIGPVEVVAEPVDALGEAVGAASDGPEATDG